jgi:hypothetical protein
MTITSARVTRSSGTSETRPMRPPIAGKIRAGIKILTPAAAKVDGADAIYRNGVATGESFDDIAAKIAKLPGMPKNDRGRTRMPLMPTNVPYFTVAKSTFAVPAAADRIMDLYGEPDRDGGPERRLYTLPIIFPSDDLDLVFPEDFQAWKASERYRWSNVSVDADGRRVLKCMKYPDMAPSKARRRQFGGRVPVVDRDCNPNDCPIFDAGECKHHGALYFWVPGVEGGGLIELKFTSVYAPLNIMPMLDLVRAGIGRISGLQNGRPIFALSKTLDNVARLNLETGKPEKTRHWIIRLETPGLVMSNVLAGTANIDALPAPKPTAAAALPSPQDVPPVEQQDTQTNQHPGPRQFTAEQKAKRKRIAECMRFLGWDYKQLHDWLTEEFGDPSVISTDDEALEAAVDKIEDLAAKKAQDIEDAKQIDADFYHAKHVDADQGRATEDEQIPF